MTTREGSYPKHEFRDGYEVFRFDAIAKPWQNPITVEMLPRLLSYDIDSFDIIHGHSHLMFTTNLAALKSRISHKPFIITNHGFSVQRGAFFDFAEDAYLSSLGRLTLASADYVISFTNREREKTIAAGVSPERAIVIPNGVDTQLFRPESCESIPHSVIWTGRFVAEKGLTYLLEAANILKAEFQDLKLIFVGYGEDLPKLLGLTRRLGLGDNVVFLEPKTQQEIVNLLNRCTLLALPSLTEGFPSTVLEAMSCQKPVVVTSNIGLEEIVGDAGLYVPPGNSQALAEKMKMILKSEELGVELGRQGRERVVKYYDWSDVVVRSVNDLFENATAQKLKD
jgi:glycosyltransferase involved in cell wall biosynthesis